MGDERNGLPRRRLLVLGLDGVPPEFLFERYRDVTPNLTKLLDHALRAPLRTTDPPISVPAWPVMFTGVDPGTLGVYGFRHRKGGSYTEMYLPTSRGLPVPTIWETLSVRGYRVAVVGMPLGYPPPPVNGAYISDFLTPSDSPTFTHPAELRAEIEDRFGPYPFDVVFRSQGRDQLFPQLLAMTRKRFEIARWLYEREPWDVFAVHEIGTDRLNHAYWKYFNRDHPRHEPGNRFEHVDLEYYAALDQCIGSLLELTDERTIVVIASDHGSMSMNGCFCINQWLEAKGYLVLKRPPPAPGTPLEKAEVDWKATTAWGEGGYYARIFFNVRGREPSGAVPAGQVVALRRQIARDLATITDPEGRPIGVRILDPREIYATVRGDAPDLIVYLGELRWRSGGTIGHPGLFLQENDIGPDDAVHGVDGVFLLYDPKDPVARTHATIQIRDVTPTLLSLLGEPIPRHVQGSPVLDVVEHVPGARPPTSEQLAAAPLPAQP
ncbi:MAG: alkaline phosphatase family protein [Thermoplasmata archaeon]|nr:alkaline phosphatase family protein [Thermoplasmata archaeon]